MDITYRSSVFKTANKQKSKIYLKVPGTTSKPIKAAISDFEATMVLMGNDPFDLAFVLTINTASMRDETNGIENHLYGVDDRNAVGYPLISFISTDIAVWDYKKYKLFGTLMIQEVSRIMVIDAIDRSNYDDNAKMTFPRFEFRGKIYSSVFEEQINIPQNKAGNEIELYADIQFETWNAHEMGENDYYNLDLC
ncbi:polyisoprenoid-binding protein YceI [Algoriphagus sp. 4150]|uniref:YceI family protein n=1 Tax=Algoriphagus sp. 4150 TaxID=2817756 RepID=UPI00285714DD|nr:YceI family protein [Algoriphagus sp. 4150]MDR7127996.1 polyisoprenoid-binding protein YceI [Algoriphagus sp. 4150]